MEEAIQVLNHEEVQSSGGLAKIKNWVLYLTIFLMPLIFWQPKFVGTYSVKITFLATSLFALIVIFFISVLSGKSFSMPKSKIYAPLLVFMGGVLAASLFSGTIEQSFAGTVFDLGTSGSLLILSGLLIVISVLIKKESVIKFSIFAFLASQAATLLYLILRSISLLILPQVGAKLNILPAGGVTSTALLMGAAVIISLCALNMSAISKKLTPVFWALIVGGTIFIGASGFVPSIVLLGLFSLVYFVYLISWSLEGSQISMDARVSRKVSASSLFVLVASVVFLVSGNIVTGFLSSKLQISSLEVRPNMETTLELVSKAWKENPLFGVGPNRFMEFWTANRPADLNSSPFWATDFSFGYGFVPTLAVTTGFLGLVPLLVFLGLFIRKGFKAVFLPMESPDSRFVLTSVFLASVYLWLSAFVYVPDISVLAVTFIFSGLFMAELVSKKIEDKLNIEMFSNPKTNFISVFFIVTLLISSIAAGYFVWERAVAARFFGQGISLVNSGDVENGRAKMVQALDTVQSDIYWRAVSGASLIKFNSVLQAESRDGQISEQGRIELQTVIGEAVESARQAINLNPGYYANWLTLANTYEFLAMNGVEGSLQSAKSTYNEALLRSPNHPAVHLALGRIEAMSGNAEGAKTEINKAIELKRNYTEAYFTLAQIEAAGNNISGAIKSVESASVIDPNNAGLFFQLGLLKYGNKDFSGAAGAFERAIEIVPDYANAKYFLGLSYNSLNRGEESIKQFEDLEKTNPDNQEIKLILSNLKAGKNPFADAKPPVDNKPEKRPEPPIEE